MNTRRQTIAANYVIPESRSDQDEIILYSDTKKVLNSTEHTVRTILPDKLKLIQYILSNEKASTYLTIFSGFCTLGSSIIVDQISWKTYIPQIMVLLTINYLFCLLCDVLMFKNLLRSFDFWYNLIIYTIHTILSVVYRRNLIAQPIEIILCSILSSILSIILFTFCISICDCAPRSTHFMRRSAALIITIYCVYSLVLSYFFLNISQEEVCIQLYSCAPVSSIIRSLKTSNIIFLVKLIFHIIRYPDTMFFIQSPTCVVPYSAKSGKVSEIELSSLPRRRTSAAIPQFIVNPMLISTPVITSGAGTGTVHLSSNIETLFGKDRFRFRPVLGKNPIFSLSRKYPSTYYISLILLLVTYLSFSIIWSKLPIVISTPIIGVSFVFIVLFILSNTDLTCLYRLAFSFDFIYFMFNVCCLFVLFIFYCDDYITKDSMSGESPNEVQQYIYVTLTSLGGLLSLIGMGSVICMPNLNNTVKKIMTILVIIYFIYQRLLIGLGYSSFQNIEIPFVYFDKSILVSRAVTNLLNIIIIRLFKILLSYLSIPRVMPMISTRIRIRVT